MILSKKLVNMISQEQCIGLQKDKNPQSPSVLIFQNTMMVLTCLEMI